MPEDGSLALVKGPYFRLDMVDGQPSGDVAARYAGPLLVVPNEGEVRVDGDETVAPGQCALVPSLASATFASHGRCLIAQPIR